jgi:hypothetical protein
MTVCITDCEVRVSPDEVDAGAPVTLEARLSTDPPADLTGRRVDVTDAAGHPVGTLTIAAFDGTANATEPLALPAPRVPGTHLWHAALRPEAAEAAAPHPFEVTVRAHAPRLLVWDVPGAVGAGGTFTARLGLKCPCGCDLTGRAFEIVDADGAPLASGRFPGAFWPGTEGLLHAEIALPAPEAEGLHHWQARVAADRGEPPHDAVAAELRVRAAPPGECLLRIEAVTAEEEAPLPGASVVLHPYRARTDDSGVAEIRVPRGLYRVYVSGPGRYPVQREIEITADLTERAPLQAEPPPSKDW